DSFSKTLAPGCRVGYVTCNSQFAQVLQNHCEVSTQQPSGFSQTILSEMLNHHWGQEGYSKYIKETVRVEYYRRCQFLLNCFKTCIDPRFASFNTPSAGMFI